jgi:hypothetical protein
MTFIAVHVELPVRLRVHNLKFLHINSFEKSPRRNYLPGANRFFRFGAGLGKSAMQALVIDRLGF